jgi:hypothetical protein
MSLTMVDFCRSYQIVSLRKDDADSDSFDVVVVAASCR